MIKIAIYEKDENGDLFRSDVRNLRPRRYMCGWNFQKLLKYIKEELYWMDVPEDAVESVILYCDEENWEDIIHRS